MSDEKKEYKLLTPGTHLAVAVSGALQEDKHGDPQYVVKFRLLEGPDSGKHITMWSGFKGGGMEFTTKMLMVLGWDGKANLYDGWTVDPEKKVYVGHSHKVMKATDKYPEKTNDNVDFVNAIDGSGGPQLKKLEPAKGKAVGDTLMARIAASQGGGTNGGGSSAPVEFSTGSTSNDDDIPF